MEIKRLGIDISELQTSNYNEKFTLRYSDINENQQNSLAVRIKNCARQRKIRNYEKPEIETIKKTLKEINPIIISESSHFYRHPWQHFGRNRSYSLTGYSFNNLCHAIYLMACVKRPLTRREIKDITFLTNRNWDKVVDYVNNLIPISNEENNSYQITNTQELGLEEINEINRNFSIPIQI